MKKLTDKLEYDLNEKWDLDFDIVQTKHAIAVHAKPRKYKNYTYISGLIKDEALFTIIHYKEFIEFTNDCIRGISNDNKWN